MSQNGPKIFPNSSQYGPKKVPKVFKIVLKIIQKGPESSIKRHTTLKGLETLTVSQKAKISVHKRYQMGIKEDSQTNVTFLLLFMNRKNLVIQIIFSGEIWDILYLAPLMRFNFMQNIKKSNEPILSNIQKS